MGYFEKQKIILFFYIFIRVQLIYSFKNEYMFQC